MPDLLLDTHILVWWRTEPGRLSRSQQRALRDREATGAAVHISAITLWELAKMVELRRLSIEDPLDIWLTEIESNPLLTVLPVSARIAAESVGLGPDFHRDPADQIIVATARCHGLRLLTADDRIRQWGKIMVV